MSPDRFDWALSILDPHPTDHLLEIGCGHGSMLSLICPILTTGHLTAIDRSAKMIDAAAKKNAACVESGTLTLIPAAIDTLDVPDQRFDKVFAFNVNIFWMQPERELDAIRRLLAPNGTLYLFYQPPDFTKAQPIIDATRANLIAGGFTIRDVLTTDDDAIRSLCVIAST